MAENTKRNPLAADTEPTDDELGDVMREARDLAMLRKGQSDSWMRSMLVQAVADARARDTVVVHDAA
ncbi:hypothetical protein [Gallionella capsiferriformans]|uniref:Uncharacterized protein n=1 Tax=Gallionella capsiferriformans (strain ES-2) TaxID=395494 RepID=D9SG52_GALCS|nr:hypothetical protein [Gallionella capsiferriformans]ADL55499.1 hypothetical protein Galf_1480 [Gallionella capsiferriformans ES-2]